MRDSRRGVDFFKWVQRGHVIEETTSNVSCSFLFPELSAFPHQGPYLLPQAGQKFVPIVGFAVTISAKTALSHGRDRAGILVQHSPQRSKDRQARPPLIPLDPSQPGPIRPTCSIFERIQFRTATFVRKSSSADSPAVRGHQLVVELFADIRRGSVPDRVMIATKASVPIGVRGQNPNRYKDRASRTDADRRMSDDCGKTLGSGSVQSVLGTLQSSMDEALSLRGPNDTLAAMGSKELIERRY